MTIIGFKHQRRNTDSQLLVQRSILIMIEEIQLKGAIAAADAKASGIDLPIVENLKLILLVKQPLEILCTTINHSSIRRNILPFDALPSSVE